jgi:hypothetical protein
MNPRPLLGRADGELQSRDHLTHRQRAGLTIPGKLLALADEVID